MKLSSITIEGMHRVDKKTYHFNNLNYLHGVNGAGKSTVLQAVQLALLGYVPGTGKTKEAIIRHANNHTLAVTAVLDDDGTAVEVRRVWTGKPPRTVSTVEISPESYNLAEIVSDIELPIFNFSEFMGMTANNLKNWFISFLPKSDNELDWRRILEEGLGDICVSDTELIPSLIQYSNTLGVTGVEAVRNMNAYMKSLLSCKEAELKRVQHTIQSLIFYDDADLSDTDVEDIQSKIQSLNATKNTAISNNIVKDQRAALESRLANVHLSADSYADDVNYRQAIDELNSIVQRIDDISEEKYTLSDRKIKLNASINVRMSVVKGNGICPFTSTKCDSIKEIVNRYNSEIADARKQIEDITKDFNNLDEEYKQLLSKKSDCQRTIETLQRQYSEYENIKQRLSELPETDGSDVDISFIDSEITALTDKLAKLQANVKYNELIDNLTSEKYVIEQSIIALKAWIKLTDANNLQTTMMEAPFEAFAGELNEYIPMLFSSDDISAKFNMSSKANSFTFGVTRNGNYIPFDLLSSGEKCLYTLALMMCIVKHAKSSLKLVMIDDMLDHLDDANINVLFESLNNIEDIQLVFAGVKPCISNNAEDIVIEVS